MRPRFKHSFDPIAMSRYLTVILQTKDLSASRRSVGDQVDARGKVQEATFYFSPANRHSLACLFSALPHAQSVQSSRLFQVREIEKRWRRSSATQQELYRLLGWLL